MRRAVIAHILLLAFGLNSLVGATGGIVVVCLGGGHEHGPADIDHCESACVHSSALPFPFQADNHNDNCGCTDVELDAPEVPTLPRIHQGAWDVVAVAPAPDWGVVVIEAGLGRRGPPLRQPPWFNPAGEQRIEFVSSVVLTI